MATTTAAAEGQTYYWAGGERIPLHRDERIFAVRYRPGARSDAAVSRPAARLLREEARSVGHIPAYGLHVYVAAPTVERDADIDAIRADLLLRVRSLAAEPEIEYASPAFRRAPDDPEVMFVRPRIVVEFMPNATREQIDELNGRFGTTIVERVPYVENGYLLEAPEADGDRGALTLAARYYESELVLTATPDLVRRRHLRQTTITGAPPEEAAERAVVAAREGYTDQQWHLATAKVVDAWRTTAGDSSIHVAVLDDGVDVGHPEFSGKVTAQYDFENHVADGSPKLTSDAHGTACAGVAVARGSKANGAAPGCSLIAVRTPEYLGVADEARMFQWAADNGADVISCSWGPADGYGTSDPLPDATRAAIHYCLTAGRGGRGIPVFWAAGNGNESVSLDGYASNPEVIAVAASTSAERRAWYSDTGQEVDICAPSSGSIGSGEREIFTTDRRGADGYNRGLASLGDPAGDYTNDFGGTSSATPLAAGIAGLVLSVNPSLTAAQVKDCLQRTADKIGSPSSYDASGHSREFGYGRVNAQRAVEEARRLAGGADGGAPVTGDAVGTSVPGGPSIRAPRRVRRTDLPPTFEIDRAGRAYYAVEVATRAELFDAAAHEAERTLANFHPAWNRDESDIRDTLPYTLPDNVWSRLEQTQRLYFRVHVADDIAWSNYHVTTQDSDALSAPAIEIVEAAAPSTPTPTPTTPATPEAGARTVRYPSGATFVEVLTPGDTIDYEDPVANRVVPLIEVEGRLDTALSTNFKVREFAARQLDNWTPVQYSRISPELIEQLQRLRERVGAPVKVSSGYRYPALNNDVEGANRSQHMAGRAADISCNALTPLELARVALETIGFDIGVGLGRTFIHIDVRGELASWTYAGSELDEAGFDAWVRELQRSLGRSVRVAGRQHEEEDEPRIAAPERWPRLVEPPTFTVWPGGDRNYIIQVATDWRLFDAERFGLDPTPDTFYSTEEDGLLDGGGAFQLAATLPIEAWERLRAGDQLFYRLLTLLKYESERAAPEASTYDDDADQAPSIELFDPAEARDELMIFRPVGADRARDERLWRRT